MKVDVLQLVTTVVLLGLGATTFLAYRGQIDFSVLNVLLGGVVIAAGLIGVAAFGVRQDRK